jgi:hypothetical protein
MKSETGALLTKIAGIITLALAGLISILLIIVIVATAAYQRAPVNLMLIFLIIPIIFFAIGFLILSASKKMETPKTTRNGAIWAIVIGALTIQTVIGILVLIGGVIALIDSNK